MQIRTDVGDIVTLPKYIADRHPNWIDILKRAPKVEYRSFAPVDDDLACTEDTGKVEFLAYLGITETPSVARLLLPDETTLFRVDHWVCHAQRLPDFYDTNVSGVAGYITRVEYRIIVRLTEKRHTCPHCGKELT